MKISLGHLRKLIREAGRDTMMAPTEPAEATPESMKAPSFGGSRSPLDTKVAQVMKIMARQGKHVNSADVKKLLSTVDPQRLLVLSADEITRQVEKKLGN